MTLVVSSETGPADVMSMKASVYRVGTGRKGDAAGPGVQHNVVAGHLSRRQRAELHAVIRPPITPDVPPIVIAPPVLVSEILPASILKPRSMVRLLPAVRGERNRRD